MMTIGTTETSGHQKAFISISLLFLSVHAADSQTPPKLAIDATRPIVYIEFDHAGPRAPVLGGEPNRGLWLRLVNNSVLAINVRANGTSTDPEMTILPDVITPRMVPIPENGLPRQKMPRGYGSSVATQITVVWRFADVQCGRRSRSTVLVHASSIESTFPL